MVSENKFNTKHICRLVCYDEILYIRGHRRKQKSDDIQCNDISGPKPENCEYTTLQESALHSYETVSNVPATCSTDQYESFSNVPISSFPNQNGTVSNVPTASSSHQHETTLNVSEPTSHHQYETLSNIRDVSSDHLYESMRNTPGENSLKQYENLPAAMSVTVEHKTKSKKTKNT